jgi:hypothetical protein
MKRIHQHLPNQFCMFRPCFPPLVITLRTFSEFFSLLFTSIRSAQSSEHSALSITLSVCALIRTRDQVKVILGKTNHKATMNGEGKSKAIPVTGHEDP